MIRNPLAAVLLVTVLLTALSGCGFKLRSWALDESVGSLFVASGQGGAVINSAPQELARELTRALESAGTVLAEDRQSADVVVEIIDERRQRRSVSVTERAQSAEYEVSRGVQYQLLRGEAVLIAPSWLRIQRVLRLDRNNIVGSNEEQALLERELAGELVQQMIRSINLSLQTDP